MAQPKYPFRYCEIHSPDPKAPLVVKFIEDRAEFIDFVRAIEVCFVPVLLERWIREWSEEERLPDHPPQAA